MLLSCFFSFFSRLILFWFIWFLCCGCSCVNVQKQQQWQSQNNETKPANIHTDMALDVHAIKSDVKLEG